MFALLLRVFVNLVHFLLCCKALATQQYYDNSISPSEPMCNPSSQSAKIVVIN